MMKFPQVDLPIDMVAWDEVTQDILGIYQQACQLKACIFALCIEGQINVSINLMPRVVKQHDFVVLMPETIIQLHEHSADIRIAFLGFSNHCVSGINLYQSTVQSFSRIMESPILSLWPGKFEVMRDYMSLMARAVDPEAAPDTIWARKVLDIMLYSTNKLYGECPPQHVSPQNRKEEICRKLVQLVIENYKDQRQVQFYADRLGISLQHLSNTVRQVSGKTVLDIIASVILVDAKAKLKSTDMTIQEIAYSLNFPNASFFGKYFKRHMGISPLEYRKS